MRLVAQYGICGEVRGVTLLWGCRLPLGVPSRLPVKALQIAEQLIERLLSRRAAGRAAEREAGYILLGALCISLPPDALQVQGSTLTASPVPHNYMSLCNSNALPLCAAADGHKHPKGTLLKMDGNARVMGGTNMVGQFASY